MAFFFNDLQSQLYLICILIFSFLEIFFIIALLEEGEREREREREGEREREREREMVLQNLFLLSWRILNTPNPLSPPPPCHPFLRPVQEQAPPNTSLHHFVQRALEGV